MIGLTDKQLETVKAAAARVPVEWRSQFLEAIVDRLLAVDDVTDDHVHAAVSFVSKKIGVAA